MRAGGLGQCCEAGSAALSLTHVQPWQRPSLLTLASETNVVWLGLGQGSGHVPTACFPQTGLQSSFSGLKFVSSQT